MAKKQPPFKTEAQEAEWWAKNQNLIADRFEQAKAAGKLGKGTVARVARAGQPSRSVANDHNPVGGRRPHASQNLRRREGVAVPDVPQNAAAPSSELRGEKGGASVAKGGFLC